MNPKQPNSPNPYHQAETFSTAETQIFECEALASDHPEIVAREQQRLERLKNADNPEPNSEA